MKKRLVIITICMVLVFSLAGCCFSHEWLEADCENPRHCSKCDKTEGEALGHKWSEADCTTPKTCSVCGATDGEPLPHNFEDATCTSPMTCSDCGTTEGEPLAHLWIEATCTEARTCNVCGTTQGSALGHTESNEWQILKEATAISEGEKGVSCSVCGEIVRTEVYRLPPESITVLTPTGFIMGSNEYIQHLLRYLPIEYHAEENSSGYVLTDGDKEISVYWSEGESGSEDNVGFIGNKWTLESLLEELIYSIDAEVTEEHLDQIMPQWISARDTLTQGKMMAIPLQTGMLIVYNGRSGYQLMFCTLQYYLANVTF